MVRASLARFFPQQNFSTQGSGLEAIERLAVGPVDDLMRMSGAH